jgi:hypothetical protein
MRSPPSRAFFFPLVSARAFFFPGYRCVLGIIGHADEYSSIISRKVQKAFATGGDDQQQPSKNQDGNRSDGVEQNIAFHNAYNFQVWSLFWHPRKGL